MLKLLPILLLIAYCAAVWFLSAWRLKQDLTGKSTPLSHPRLTPLLARLGEALDLPPIRAHVYHVDEVNGLAAPDGRIFLTRGFITKLDAGEVTPEELASVVAHELGHGVHQVLAAGQGSRMQSDLPKVLHRLGGMPLVGHALLAGRSLEPQRVIVVAGHGAEAVTRAVARLDPEARIAIQDRQLGTGHAVAQALPLLDGFDGKVVVLYGDTPFIGADTLAALASHSADVVVLGFEAADPGRYGRLVVRNGALDRIVEFKDADEATRRIALCNSGVMAADAGLLRDLVGPAGEAEAAEPVVRRSGGDRVRRPAARLDVLDGLVPRVTEADVEARRVEPHLGAHDPAQQDVADLGAQRVGPPRHPVLLDQHARQPEVRRHRLGMHRLVKALLVKADGEGLYAARRRALHQRDDRRRVDAAR